MATTVTPRTRARWSIALALALVGALVLLLLADGTTPVGRPGADGTVEIALEDYRFDPAAVSVPADTPVTLVFVNRDEVTHHVSFGRGVVEEDGRAVGFEEDLMATAVVSVTPRSAMTAARAPYRSASVAVHGGQTVTVDARFTPSQRGDWQVGCFTGRGCHLQAGLLGTLTVQ
jgi:plastocyanin